MNKVYSEMTVRLISLDLDQITTSSLLPLLNISHPVNVSGWAVSVSLPLSPSSSWSRGAHTTFEILGCSAPLLSGGFIHKNNKLKTLNRI